MCVADVVEANDREVVLGYETVEGAGDVLGVDGLAVRLPENQALRVKRSTVPTPASTSSSSWPSASSPRRPTPPQLPRTSVHAAGSG